MRTKHLWLLLICLYWPVVVFAESPDIIATLQQQGVAAADKAYQQARAANSLDTATFADIAMQIGEQALSENDNTLALQYFSDAVILAPDNGYALIGVGAALIRTGIFDRAETYLNNAKELAEKQKNNALLSEALNALAAIKQYSNDIVAAIPLLEKAIAADERELGQGHPDIALRYHNLAQLYQLQKRFDEAEKLYQKAMQITLDNRRYGEGATYAAALGKFYNSQKQYDKAITTLSTAIDNGNKATNNQAHPLIAAWHKQRADAYTNTKRIAEAKNDITAAIDIIKNGTGNDNNAALSLLYNDMAMLFAQEDAYGKAEEYLQKAIGIQSKIFDDTHPALLDSRSKLVNVYYAQQRFDEAVTLLTTLLALADKTPSFNISIAAGWRLNLATIYNHQNKLNEAAALYERAIKDLTVIVGKDNPFTQNAQQSYDKFRKQHNRK